MTMNKIFTYIIGMLCVGSLCVSCSSDDNLNMEQQGEDVILSLQIENSELKSRATIAESENSIKTLDIYLYPNNKTDEKAVFQYSHVLTNANTTGTETVTVNVPGNVVSKLFAVGINTCIAYVVANIGTTNLPTDDTSMASLKGAKIEADFTVQPELFVMDGSNKVSYNPDSKSISGTIPLYRAASKISLTVTNVKTEVQDDFGNTWESDPQNQTMKISFYNGVKVANVDVTSVPYTISDTDYFNIAGANSDRNLVSTTEGYTHTQPFYSYSSAWEPGSPKAAYLMVMVPWKKKGEDTFKPCYYQIPINEEGKKLDRNHYYQIKLNIGILGSFTPDEPKTITDATYVVLNWSNAETSAELKEYRYLVVDKNFVEMDNVENHSIKFSTSHKTEIVNAVLKRPVLNPLHSNDETISSNLYTLEPKVVDGQNYIYFEHSLDNEWSDTDKSYDYVPYTLELDIKHEDNPDFIEHITIVQYPAIYVVANLNSDYKKDDNENNDNSNNGYVKVNNSTDSYGNVTGLGSAENANPNMYTITTTVLPSRVNYVIGDPRISVINNNLGDNNNNWSTNAPTLPISNSNRKLLYYYPTDDSSNKKNLISPQFRIASSYGVTSSITFDNARKRCASYQEDGYPAGRWRIPTYAEVEYIVKLSAEAKIPKLFNDGGSYWAANKSICKPSHTNGGSVSIGSGNSAYVRCVYDEWYWTDKCDKGTFTWGDREITW